MIQGDAVYSFLLRTNLNVGYANGHFTSTVLNSGGSPVVVNGVKIGFLPGVNEPWNVIAAASYEIPLDQLVTCGSRKIACEGLSNVARHVALGRNNRRGVGKAITYGYRIFKPLKFPQTFE
jgi:hypothetical protein